jgi:Bacterial conjugation TrbI-like protein
MTGTRTAPFGTPATRLHGGRIALVAILLIGAGVAAWAWVFHRGTGSNAAVTESSTNPPWTIAQMQYDKPEITAEPPPAPPVDTVGPQLAKILAMLNDLTARVTALENRKPPAAPVVKETPKAAPPKKAPAPVVFVHHDVKDTPPALPTREYTLAPGTTKLPCIVETGINSDVEGYLTAKVSTNVYDTATGRHLLVPQGSTILGHDQSQQLLYGNERLPTISLSLSLPDGRTVDLGKAPITDQQGVAGLTGDVNNHWGRLFGAVFIGGALRGGTQALTIALSDAAGAGQFAAGYSGVLNQAVSPRLGRALDTRPTITVDAGQLCNVILVKPLTLPAMWQ